jgi:hypothetical protein
MADIIEDGNIRVDWVPTIANIAAPTTTELNAGTPLTLKMTPDGLMGFEPATADVDNSSLASTVDTNRAGRDSYSGTGLKFKKQTGTDTIHNLLVKYLTGYVVIRRDSAYSTAWASSDKVEVYPGECGQTKRNSPTKNTLATFEVPVKIYSDPNLRAVVA